MFISLLNNSVVQKKMTNITTMTLPYVFQLFDFFMFFMGSSRSLVGVVAIFAPIRSLLSVCLDNSNFTNSVVHTVDTHRSSHS